MCTAAELQREKMGERTAPRGLAAVVAARHPQSGLYVWALSESHLDGFARCAGSSVNKYFVEAGSPTHTAAAQNSIRLTAHDELQRRSAALVLMHLSRGTTEKRDSKRVAELSRYLSRTTWRCSGCAARRW